MELSELATEYRISAAPLKERIAALQKQLKTEKMCEMERLRLRSRIDILYTMYRQTMATAGYLERYYI